MINPFETKDKKIEKDVSHKLNVAGDIARACLSMEQFGAYRKKYEVAENTVIDSLMFLTDQYNLGHITLQDYGVKVLVTMTKLKSVKSLLQNVELDSKKGRDGR